MSFREEDAVIQWLLGEDNPPVRYVTLKNLLNQKGNAAKAWADIMNYPVIQEILTHLDEFLEHSKAKAYWKYKGQYWQVIFLGQLLAVKEDPRIATLAEHVLANHEKWNWLGNPQVLNCLIANLTAALMTMGYWDHPVVKQKCEILAQYVIKHRGIHCTAMVFSLLKDCYMAVPKLLSCFAGIPEKERSPAVLQAIDILVNILLDNQVYCYVPANNTGWQKVMASLPKKADLPDGQTVKEMTLRRKEQFLKENGPGERTVKKGWLKFGFPLHYNSDILETMYTLALLDIPMSPQLEKPLQAVIDRRTEEGYWLLDNTLNGKMWVDIEAKGKPSKWLTYRALYVLRHFNGE